MQRSQPGLLNHTPRLLRLQTTTVTPSTAMESHKIYLVNHLQRLLIHQATTVTLVTAMESPKIMESGGHHLLSRKTTILGRLRIGSHEEELGAEGG